MSDEQPIDFQDEKGGWHIMCACGHTVSGTVKPGDKIALCPNCQIAIRFKSIPIVFADRLPDVFKKDDVFGENAGS